MSAPSSCDNLASALLDMEDAITAVKGWAHLIADLGTCPDEVSPKGLFEAGRGMLDAASAVEDGWRRCLDLTGGKP